jgi:hypothetical protein
MNGLGPVWFPFSLEIVEQPHGHLSFSLPPQFNDCTFRLILVMDRQGKFRQIISGNPIEELF